MLCVACTIRGLYRICTSHDFFDAVNTEDGLAVVLADVAGKGVSAALLASTLQGMIYSQLVENTPKVICLPYLLRYSW